MAVAPAEALVAVICIYCRQIRKHDFFSQMPYLEAFLHEVQRHGSLAPLAVPHSVTRDCQYRGYDFKKHMGVSFNLVQKR